VLLQKRSQNWGPFVKQETAADHRRTANPVIVKGNWRYSDGQLGASSLRRGPRRTRAPAARTFCALNPTEF
jgi:hypothetical protein